MSSLLFRSQHSKVQTLPAAPMFLASPTQALQKDPNLPDPRLQIKRRCIYERHLPGGAYIAAHVERLQHGFWESPAVSDASLNGIIFLALTFVLHPADKNGQRFKGATIRVSAHSELDASLSSAGHYTSDPRFLMFAPHLMYGAVSPETLQWNFNLAGTLGISQPLVANLTPSGALQGSYKFYEMMKIQGSLRTNSNFPGPGLGIEDGEVHWSLKENMLQRSGLPREFTFVMLLHQSAPEDQILINVDIDPTISSWFGSYPSWWLQLDKYLPVKQKALDTSIEVGQRFEPYHDQRGFNFAQLSSPFEDYISMPGSVYSTNVSPDGVVTEDSSKMHLSTSHQTDTSLSEHAMEPTITSHPISHAPRHVQGSRDRIDRGYRNNSSNTATLNVRVFLDDASLRLPLPVILREASPNLQGGRRSLRRSKSRQDLNVNHNLESETYTDPSHSRNRYSYHM